MTNVKHSVQAFLWAALLAGFATQSWCEESVDSWEKVVFHLDETVNARWSLMLAQSYIDDSPRAKIGVVAYGPGIDFLLEDAKDKHGDPYDHAVLSLVNRGVEFRVCAATLGARKVSNEDLIDAVSIVPSGISEIARLQLKEGYAYLKP